MQSLERASSAGPERRELLVIGVCTVLLLLFTVTPLNLLLPFAPGLPGGDIDPVRKAAADLLNGALGSHYQPGPAQLYYPAPFVVLLSPLALVAAGTALAIVRVTATPVVVLVLFAWGSDLHDREVVRWTLALSLPVVATIFLGQLPTTLSLAAITVAVLAQRRERWALVGIAMAFAMIRPVNALPVLAMLAVAGWSRPRNLLKALVAGAAVLAVLTVPATLGDPRWLGEYLAGLGTYPYGLAGAISRGFGWWAVLIPLLLVCAATAYWARRSYGGPLDLDRAAAGVALGVLVAPLSAPYAAVYGIPAVFRVASRRPTVAVGIAATVLPWLTVALPQAGALALSFYIMGTTISAISVLAAIPLLLRMQPRPADA